nr:hypothetical protein [Rickettsia tillamookensis]
MNIQNVILVSNGIARVDRKMFLLSYRGLSTVSSKTTKNTNIISIFN